MAATNEPACRCIEEAEAKLAEYNAALVCTFWPIQRPVIETMKRDTKKRGKPPIMVASFCPFCGTAYPKEPTP